MRPTHALIVPALIAVIGLTGCNDTARGDYPDRSPQTRAEADAIRSDGDRRVQNIDRELQQTQTSLAFTRQQNADKAKLERDQIALERDQKVKPLQAKKAEIEAKSKRECERIEQDAESRAAGANTEEAARIRAEAATKVAQARSDEATQVAEIDTDIREAQQAAQKRLANVDEGEAKMQADVDAKRLAADTKAREQRLKVQEETTAKLDRLAKDSADRQGDRTETDERITSQVRQNIARHGEPAQKITVATDNGVVQLGGEVSTETVRRAVVTDAQKIDGVVRVDDRIAVH